MPRGPAPAWKARKQPILDDHVIASYNGGMDQTTGHYQELIYTGIEDEARAYEIKNALYRSARHAGRALGFPDGFSMSAKVERCANGTYQVRYKAIDKVRARQHVIDKYGPDPANWPYDPRRKKDWSAT